jgi:hypothetical protein
LYRYPCTDYNLVMVEITCLITMWDF